MTRCENARQGKADHRKEQGGWQRQARRSFEHLLEGPGGSLGRRLDLPGDREAIRARATVAALHLMRMLLARNRDE